MKKQEITIKSAHCTCGYQELYQNGGFAKAGDRYHDNIMSVIDGYLLYLDYNKIEYETKYITIDCPYECDE
jgi:hypothetical protein